MIKLQFKFLSILFQHNFIWGVSLYAGSRRNEIQTFTTIFSQIKDGERNFFGTFF